MDRHVTIITSMSLYLIVIMFFWGLYSGDDQVKQPTPVVSSNQHFRQLLAKLDSINVSTVDSVEEISFGFGPTQTERHNIIREACSHGGGNKTRRETPPKYWQSYRVLEKYQVVINIMPKCGGTNLCRVLLNLAGIHNNTEDVAAQTVVRECKKYIPNLLNYTAENRTDILMNFKKVVFVRNPFTRLLSAFRDRLETYPNRNPNQRRLHNKKIFTMFGNHSKEEMPDPSVESEMYNVTFKSFVSYYLSGHMDVHWTEQYKLAPPCSHFDLIGKLETFDDDLNQLLTSMKVDPSLYQFKSLNPTHSSEENILKRYYSTLTNQQMEKLVELLTPDMKYFGYFIPEVIQR